MANLLEILNDPNYVNANLTTKNAIFQKYAPLDENYSKANNTTQLAIKDRFGVGGLDEFGDSPNAVKEVLSNAVPSLLSGLGGLAQFPGKLADLVTGTAPDAEPGLIRKGIGAFLPFASTGAREAGGKLEEFGKELKTPTLRRKEKERAAAVEAAEGELNKFKVAGLETITDPSLLGSFLLEQAPNALGSAGIGLLTKAGGKLLFKEASKTALNAAGTSASIATQVAQQGTDVGYDTYKYIYDELVKGGMSKEQANSIAIEKGRVAALEGGAISYALSRIPGAREFEKMLFRDAAKAGVSPATFLQGLRRGAAGGGASEMGEEGGGKFASNVGIQEVFPEYKLSTGLGETTAMAGIGGSTTSGVFGGLNARAEAKAIKQNEDAIAKANAPFQYVEPQTGTTMTASVTELDDPNLVFVGTQEVGGRKVYVYAPAEQITPEGRPDLTSPIVATMKTTVGGKESIKTTRADGSIDIDGVLVTPPRQAPEGDVAQSREQMMAEFEGQQLPLVEQPIDQAPTAVPQDTVGLNDGDRELLSQVTATQPAQFTDPDTGTAIIISLTKLNDPALKVGEEVVYGGKTYYTYVQIPQKDTSGQLELAPVNPEGTVLPTPPAAPPVNTAGQLTLAPVNPEGTVIAPAKPVDPNVEAQLAAVEPDVESMIPDEPPPVRAAPPAPVVPAKRVAAEPTARYGITDKGEVGVPLTEGGKPFQTRKEAEKVQKLQPQLRILPLKVKGKVTGYVLADKTQKQLAAEKVAAKRLQAIPVGGLLGDILRQGGINPVHRLVLGFSKKENPSFGNKRLFAAEGKGIDLSDIVEGQEEGKAAEDRFEGRDIDVRNSLPDRIKDAIARYNAGESEDSVVDAQERKLAEEEREFEEQENKVIQGVGEQLPSNAEFQDFYDVEVNLENPDQSMLEAGFSQQDLNVVGFTKASPELKAEVAALMAQMEALGLETADILAEISFTPNITDLEYYTRAKSELIKAITQAAKQGSGGNVSQANVSETQEGIESPTEAGLKAKQDAIDKAAAEKAKADREAAAKDKAEEQRKAIAAASEKAAGEFELGKSAEDDLSGQKPAFSRSTVEQKENAQMVADNFKGKVVYQNGDISLIQVSNVYNDPVYLPAKGTVYFTNSVESIKDTRKLFTKEELQELLNARLNIEAQDAAKHAAKPFVTFKNGMATSENVNAELAGIFKQWKSLLKLNQNIYLGTIEDAIAAKDSFAGPQRRIGNAATKLNITGTPGSTQALADGTRYILIDQNQTPAELIEILAHEMGHAHEQEMFNNAPAELQKQIKAEFDKWLNSQKGKTAKEFIYALRAKETAETTNIPNPDMLAKDLKKYDSYWSTFSEWYADQTARWATTSEKPLTAVDKFFAKVAETLRSFFKTLKSAGFLPNTTFKQYMDDITATEIVAANPITSVYEQMPLFATKSAQASLPGMPAAPNKPNKISPASLQKPKPAASWTAPDMNRKDTFIGLVQDRNISLKRVQQVIEKLPTVTQLQDNLNAYRLEDLAHGRVQVQTDDFLKFKFAPIIKEMNDNKVTEEQLTEYLLNRHAKEANELIAKRNPNNPAMQDKGSSVETKVAEDYLKNLLPAQKKLFESLAKKVDKVIVGTQELLYKNGIISKAELDGWRDTFKYYVPLRREETDYVLPSSSFKEIGSYAKSRTGSFKKVTDILSNVGIAREIAIVRSEKEKAKRAVYGLAVANPNPEFWMAVSPAAVLNQNLLVQELSQMGWDPADVKNIMAEPTKAYFNKDTGLVENKINTQNRYADFVLPVKINGQDRFVFFNPNDKRSASIITALKKADTQKLNEFNSYVGNITRYFAAVNTQYNLVFGAWNFVRDVQGAMLNLTTTPLNGKQSAVFQGTFTALKDIYAGIKEKNQGTLQKNPADGSWQDFLEAGGKIGYRDQFAKINDTSTLVARELQSLNRGNAYQKARSVLNWVSSVNDVLENAVRLSAYRVALKQNMSKDQAAEIAKNLTVNFNRKGSATAGLSAYYAFLNASIQGTARLAQTIDPRTKSGKLIIAGGLAIGMAQSLALMAAEFEDDEPSEFLKERNLIIPTGWLTGKRTYAMWPMPLGFNILPNTGRLLIDGAARLADGKGVGDIAINALSMAVSSTNPLGGNAATLQSYMPTVIDPLIAVYENKDAFGRPIAKEDRGLNPTPGYTRSREPANPIFQGIAEFMNTITSRDKDVKGLISPTADQLSYIAEQVGGGVYREASRAVKYAVNVLNGEETPEHQVPLAGKIIGDLDSNAAISQKFYTNVKNMAEHELVIKAHRTRRESVSEYMRDNPEARFWQRANSLENEITKLNKTKKELYQREAPQDRIKRVEDQKIRMMKQFNDQVRRVN